MYHSLSDYQDQNKNYINQPNQFNKKTNNNSNKLSSMKKGTMVNGSEVYYGKGIKVDPSKTNKSHYNNINNTKRINKKINNNKINTIGHNSSIQYVSKEEKITTITKTVINKREEKLGENLVDLNKFKGTENQIKEAQLKLKKIEKEEKKAKSGLGKYFLPFVILCIAVLGYYLLKKK